MKPRGRRSERENHPSAPDDGVVRLPVSDHDRSQQLEAMPAPGRRVRLQPTPAVDLHEEEAEDTPEPSPTELGMPWEEDGNQDHHETPVGWIGLIGLLLVGLGAWALTSFLKGEATIEQRAEVVEENWKVETKRQVEAEALLTRVERATAAYLAAGDIAGKVRHVRHAARVRPLMEAYYEKHPFKPLELERIDSFGPFAIEKRPFIYVNVKAKSGERLDLSMEQTPTGELKFDWESEVAYQPMSIGELVEEKPEEPLDLRVYARLDNFYSYEFSAPEKYRALLLSERDSEDFLFGYVEAGTELDRILLEILTPNIQLPKPVMLRVRFLPGTVARRSVLVEKLVSPRWIYAEDPGKGEPASGG